MGKVDITELYYWGDRYGLMTLIDRRTQSRKTQQGNLLVWQIICGTLRWRTLQNCLHTSLWDQSQLCRASHIPSSLIGVGAKMAKSHDSTLRYWYALVGIGFLWKGFDSCSHWPRWQQQEEEEEGDGFEGNTATAGEEVTRYKSLDWGSVLYVVLASLAL